MANMSYCRFYNTYHDLVDCKNALYNGDITSDEEKRYAQKLLKVCQEIADSYCSADIDEMLEDEEEECE